MSFKCRSETSGIESAHATKNYVRVSSDLFDGWIENRKEEIDGTMEGLNKKIRFSCLLSSGLVFGLSILSFFISIFLLNRIDVLGEYLVFSIIINLYLIVSIVILVFSNYQRGILLEGITSIMADVSMLECVVNNVDIEGDTIIYKGDRDFDFKQ